MKKVYFAGSIRGGREDADLYCQMIDYLKKSTCVLTEHVGNLALNVLEKNGDCAIYNQDTAWLRECDYVVAECSRPSLGVGYEMAYAERYQKPCYILYRPSVSSLSAMLSGDKYFQCFPYETWEQALEILSTIEKENNQ